VESWLFATIGDSFAGLEKARHESHGRHDPRHEYGVVAAAVHSKKGAHQMDHTQQRGMTGDTRIR
jgi:hypothetical protein